MCGAQVALGQGFLRRHEFSPVSVIPPMLHTNPYLHKQPQRRAKPQLPTKAMLFHKSCIKKENCFNVVVFNGWDTNSMSVRRARMFSTCTVTRTNGLLNRRNARTLTLTINSMTLGPSSLNKLPVKYTPEINYYVHNSPLLDPFMGQLNSVQTVPLYYRCILKLSFNRIRNIANAYLFSGYLNIILRDFSTLLECYKLLPNH